MRKRMAAAAALLAAGCASGGGGTEGIVDFDARLAPTPGNDVRGDARAVAAVGSTAVTIEVESATPGARHPWHVHTGTCGSSGPIVGDAADYPVLEVDEDGAERAVATIDVQLVDDVPYYVNVHHSPQQLGTIVACGALTD